MNLKKANLGQLLFLSRIPKYRYAAIKELDRRVPRNEIK